MELAKKGTGAIQTVILMTHKKAVCQNLFGNQPTDHFHMMVYYDDGKFTDSNPNRVWSKLKDEKGVEWNSQMVIKPQALEIYFQCEGREICSVFGDKQILERLRYANKEVKEGMQNRINDREDDRKRKRQDQRFGDDDWWITVAKKNPGELQRLIQSLGIRDVSKFLSYAARFMKEYKFDSLIYDPRSSIIENQVNAQIRKVYHSWDWWECV